MISTLISLESPSQDSFQKQIEDFHRKVFSFYRRNKRDLPWRKTTDPYKILLSEYMLQQTQVNRVVTFFERWIAKWPTIEALATASLPDVLEMWMGLGYNTRAVNLHRAAKKIIAEFKGDVLEAVKQYTELPGIGKYTSQAVQIFSTNADIATVDTNIRRILIREFNLNEDISDKELWKLAEACLPKGRSRDWHNALMDYGALHLTAHKTGIQPKSQQSRFEGSDRQIRAQILRCLLKQAMPLSDLGHKLGIEQSRLIPIIEKMTAEGIISKANNLYQLSS